MRPKSFAYAVIVMVAAIAASVAGSVAALAQSASPQAVGTSSAETPACTEGTQVETAEGPVCGTVSNGVRTYLGIRYAAPPLGALRWKAPQPVIPWTDTFEATQLPNRCMQPGANGPARSEDCLTLNVQVPADAVPGPLPVMFEIHGGGFLGGTPPDGAHLAKAGRVIVVATRYRLGILGFFAHAGLGAHSGNYGLQDQQAALRWVQRNIAHFGGDPKNVTIFGQSAGGASVCAQTMSPGAAGLFQRGISESGFYNAANGVNNVWEAADCKSRLRSLAQAEQAGAQFAEKVGCGSASDVAACMRALPAETLVEQASQTLKPDTGGTIAPTVDGVTLPMSPSEAFAKGRVNKVSVMIGADHDEINGGVNADAVIATTPEQYRTLVMQRFGSLARKVLETYPLERYPGSSPFIAYRTIVADSDSVCPALAMFDRLSKHMLVYAWEGDDSGMPRADFGNSLGAFHDSEARFNLPGANAAPFDPNHLALQQQLNAQWTGFARTGSPMVAGTPAWTPYTAKNRLVMSMVAGGASALTPASTIAAQHNCGFWNGTPARRAP